MEHRPHERRSRREQSVTANLPRGRDRALSIGALAEFLGQSRRAVEKELEAAVLDGTPIVACPSGIYVAQTSQEAREYADSLRGRIRAVQQRISALERWADENEAPTLTLWRDAA